MSSKDSVFILKKDLDALIARVVLLEAETGVLTPNRGLVTNGSGAITAVAALTDGQPMLGVTGAAPEAGTITAVASQTTVTPGPHTLAIGTVQSIATTSTPSFAGVTLNLLNANRVLTSTTGGQVTQLGALTNGKFPLGSTGFAPVVGSLTPTTDQTTVTEGAGTLQVGTAQNIGTTSSPTFAGETLTGLTLNRMMTTTTGGQVTTLGALADGKIPMGVTGGAPVAGSVVAVANQTTVVEAAGTVTVGTVQAIGTGSSPTFLGETLTGLTLNRVMTTTTGGQVTTLGALTDGQFPIGATGGAVLPGAITVVANQTTRTLAANSVTIGTVQNINTTSTPTFLGATLGVSGLTLPATGGTPTAITNYEEFSSSFGITYAGALVTSTRSLDFQQQNSYWFRVRFYSYSAAAAAAVNSITITGIPARFISGAVTDCPILIENNGLPEIGQLNISGTTWTVKRVPVANFTGTVRIYGQTIPYS